MKAPVGEGGKRKDFEEKKKENLKLCKGDHLDPKIGK